MWIKICMWAAHDFGKLISYELSDKLHLATSNNAQKRSVEQFNIIKLAYCPKNTNICGH